MKKEHRQTKLKSNELIDRRDMSIYVNMPYSNQILIKENSQLNASLSYYFPYLVIIHLLFMPCDIFKIETWKKEYISSYLDEAWLVSTNTERE